ncbi:MAG: DEAD/DEAH box helicase [Bacillaceae bacterium]
MKKIENKLIFTKEEGMPISSLRQLPLQPLQPFSYDKNLQQLLVGKKLLFDELNISLSTLQQHYNNGYVQVHKGITKENNLYKCSRCHNEDQQQFYTYECLRCHRACTYCRNCIKMGRISECTPLFSWCGEEVYYDSNHGVLAWGGTLSMAQQRASDEVVAALRESRSLLLWAVCGAGKTEMIYEGIKEALQARKRICIAAPRRDVIMELAPRLKEAFPFATMAVLHGESEEKHIHAQLVLATTHQLFRYYKAFDTVIIDEVDAFPYYYDQTLQRAVTWARKEESTLIYLTATPSLKQQRQWQVVRVPARYHGYPLPVPTITWCGNWKKSLKQGRIPTAINKWLTKQMNQRKSLFLFVPTIEDTALLKTVIQKYYSISVEGVHANDEERTEKIERFRSREIKWLITTSILERGVTIPNSNVAVIGAEHLLFTESGLVQMAGRVGRSKDYPSGEVVFFHFGKTERMITAKKQIEACNMEAKKEGLLQ